VSASLPPTSARFHLLPGSLVPNLWFSFHPFASFLLFSFGRTKGCDSFFLSASCVHLRFRSLTDFHNPWRFSKWSASVESSFFTPLSLRSAFILLPLSSAIRNSNNLRQSAFLLGQVRLVAAIFVFPSFINDEIVCRSSLPFFSVFPLENPAFPISGSNSPDSWFALRYSFGGPASEIHITLLSLVRVSLVV